MSDNRTLGTIAGAVIGYFTGGASYVALGATLGGVVGGALDGPTKIEGPRIDDQKVTVSTYGIGIPTVYGTVRIGGNVVDSTDKIELSYTSSAGGKGGGTENTSYRYFVHMRHVLCATPVDGSTVGIRKIWQDGKLIYDVSSGTPVGSALASAESPYSNLILYQGAEDQMPDFIEEQYHGVGNVPAYRGVVSVRLNIIECPGGRVPQFSFELGVDMAVSEENLPFGFVDVDASATPIGQYAAVIRSQEAWNFHSRGADYSGDYSLIVERVGAGEVSLVGSISSPGVHYGLNPCPVSGDGDPIALRLRRASSANLFDPHYLERYNLSAASLSVLYEYIPTVSNEVINPASAGYDAQNDKYVIRSSTSDRLYILTGGVTRSDPIAGTAGPVTIYANIVYAVSVVGGFLQIAKISGDTGETLATFLGPAYSDTSLEWAAIQPAAASLFVWCRNALVANLYSVDYLTGTWMLLSTNVETVPVGKEALTPTTIYADLNGALIGPSSASSGKHSYSYVTFTAVTIVPASVAGIITEQCTRAGMAPGTLDVSTIDDLVHGYTLSNPASARANIQPLMTAFAIDATEEDGKIRFFHRAAVMSSGAIAYDELGCAEDNGEPGDPMPLTRGQEAELPRSVSVSYINKDFDYQTGTERATRQITDSVMDSTLDLPMSVDSGVAATLAQRALYDAWNDRDRRSFKVSRKFAFMSAGDVMTFEYPKGTLSDWRLVKLTDTGALIEGECVPANAAIYAQTAVGGTGYSGQIVAPLPAATRLQLLDIPILRDADNNAGLYGAMDSYSDVPASAELLVGVDDNTLTPRGTVSASAPIGFAETALASGSAGSVDETNLFTVNINDDVFNSVTRDVLLANGGEFWALGAPGRWEIGCSALGSSLGSGRYILSRHLRGLFGTEYLTSTHQAGDTFVLLRIVGMLRPTMGTGDIGQPKSYRAITKGRSSDSASSQVYANTGEGLKPLSPVNLRRTNANDLTIDRRSRLSMNNNTGTLPIGEASEAYSWSFYTSGAFTTLIGSAVTSAATITAAQITTVGATLASTLYVRVSQLSDSVGLGHELQATV